MFDLDVRFTQSFFTGMVASVNPCGFVLLPTYLLYFLGINASAPGTQRATVRRALAVGSAVSAGFITVFVIIGYISRVFTNWLNENAKYAGLVIGIAMVVLGLAMLAGYRLPINTPKLQAGGKDRTVGSMYLYGVGYAIASIGCTFPLFSSIVLGTVSTDGFANGVVAIAFYGVGMALVVIALTVTLAVAQTGMLRVLRAGMRHMETVGAFVVLVTGVYLSWYWFSTIRDNLPSNQVTNVQERIQNWIYEHQTVVGWTFGLIIAAALAFVLLGKRTKPAPPTDEPAELAHADR
jgi:cytochrome c-type biogenesis protein